MDEVFVHNMEEKDIPEVFEIEKLSFNIPWSEEAFMGELRSNPSARYIIAEIDGRVVGYCGMWIILDEGHITNIAVHPHFRGRHIGDILVEALIGVAKDEKITSMTLEVRRTNTVAQNLYVKYGFQPVGVRPKYYGDNGEDAIIMWKYGI